MRKLWVLFSSLVVAIAVLLPRLDQAQINLADLTDVQEATTHELTGLVEVDHQVSPQKLQIDKLGIEVDVETVGKDEEGGMALPSEDVLVGWWKFGAGPGEMGSMVIAGHVDREEGGRGVFYDLERLDVGDQVEVYSSDGNHLTYEVYDKKFYLTERFPLEEVFGNHQEARLNLITCSGKFDEEAKDYENRLVIFTKLVKNPGMSNEIGSVLTRN